MLKAPLNRWIFFVMLLLTTPAFPTSAQAFSSAPPPDRRPYLMGVLGDSISAASLADLPIPNGDIQAQVIITNKSTLSWASGLQIRSHLVRLKEALRKARDRHGLFVSNVSYPGDQSSDLPDQAAKLVNTFNQGAYSALKYITLLIGANDACVAGGGVPTETIRANMLATFSKLAEIHQSEPVRILVVGIPRIPELNEPQIRDSKTVFGLTCHTVRNRVLNFCNSLLSWTTPEQYDVAMNIVENTNRTLRAVAKEANQRFPALNVVYSDRLYNLKIPREALAIDCFHPGMAGQEALADETWLDQPWFN